MWDNAHVNILKKEIAKQELEHAKEFRRLIISMGGVNDPDYEYLPKWCKRKTGRPLDQLVLEINNHGFNCSDANDLYKLVVNA